MYTVNNREGETSEPKIQDKILVAIGSYTISGKLVRHAYDLSIKMGIPFTVLHIETQTSASGENSRDLLENIELAKNLGGEFLALRDNDIAAGIISTARQVNACIIVVGNTRSRKNKIVQRLLRLNKDIVLEIVNHSDLPLKKPGKPRNLAVKKLFSDYLTALLGIAVVTLLNVFLAPLTGYRTIALIYLFLISLTAFFIARVGAVLSAAAVSALCLNFLFIPPVYTFSIARLEDLVMFFLYFFVALIIGTLNSRLKVKEHVLRAREKGLTALYELSNMLNRVGDKSELISCLSHYLKLHLGIDAVLVHAGDILKEDYIKYGECGFHMSHFDSEAIKWVMGNGRSAGRFTANHPESAYYLIPVIRKSEVMGILAVKPPGHERLPVEMELLLQNLLNNFAIALEREILAEKNRENLLVTESERLYKILFNLVSHELRTPITTVTGASTSLLDRKIESNRKTRRSLIREIREAGERLNRTVDNLLNMGRLESGMMRLKRELYDIRTLIDVAVRKFSDEFENRTIDVAVPDNLPLIYLDVQLMEQVMNNLLANVIAHTPPGTRLRITAGCDENYLLTTFSDNGKGLKESDIPQLFDRFYLRVKGRSRGIGLGLTICKNIVSAHGGRIEALNNTEGGAEFRIFLPLAVEKGATV